MDPFCCNQIEINVDEGNVAKQVGTEVVVNRAHGVYAIHALQSDDNYGDWGHVAHPKLFAGRKLSEISYYISVFVL